MKDHEHITDTLIDKKRMKLDFYKILEVFAELFSPIAQYLPFFFQNKWALQTSWQILKSDLILYDWKSEKSLLIIFDSYLYYFYLFKIIST